MPAPLIQSVQHLGTTLYIIFDRAITALGGSETLGFTATKTPGGVQALTFSAISNNALIVTLPGAVLTGESLSLAYVGGTGTIKDAATGLIPAPSFTITAVPYYSAPIVLRAIVGQGGNDLLSIYFTQPVASPAATLTAGMTITVNAIAISLTGATASLNDDATILTINTTSNFTYNDIVDVAYDSGTGDLVTYPAGAVADFSFTVIPNISTDGLPDSQYPLSFVTSYKVTTSSKVATGSLGVSLNPIDILLAAEYGPLKLFTGGTFGITVGNPLGITVVGQLVYVIDGLLVSQAFTDPSNISVNAVDAAQDWQVQTVAKIAFLLGQARATDQGIVYNTQQVDAV